MTPWRVLTLAAMFSVAASACTIVYAPTEVGPSFRVKVTNSRGRPVEGVRIQLDKLLSATTDADGIASFAGVRPGDHLLLPSESAEILNGVAVAVKDSSPSDVIVPLRWPNANVVPVRNVAGILRDPNHSPVQASLSLVDARSGRVLSTARSDNRGRFGFDAVPPGLYLIRLDSSTFHNWAGHEVHGSIAIEVRADANAAELNLDLGWTSCGLFYTDASQCAQPELSVDELCGSVADTSGAAIPDAEVHLLEKGDQPKVVEGVDASGGFHLRSPGSGTYELIITAPGFSPLHAVVHYRAGTSDGSGRALRVRLEIGGGCSSVE